MKALSVRQPWPYMMFHPLPCGPQKDVENRTWPTTVRGRVLIHASKGMTKAEYFDAWDFYHMEVAGQIFSAPLMTSMPRGGIVGSVEIVDCVQRSASPWFCGPHGFVLRDPRPLPFFPCSGRLGFFDIELPYQVCSRCGCHDSDCSGCIQRTGEPCFWVSGHLCSACVDFS